MSRLIRELEADRQKPVPEAVVDDVTSLRLLKAIQALAVEQARAGFNSYLCQLDEVLDDRIAGAPSDREASELAALQKVLLQKRSELERYFCGYVAEGFVKFRKQQLKTVTACDAGSAAELSIVDNDKLEEMITISSISRRANVYYAEPLWALNQRLAVLHRGGSVVEENNPAAPVQLCESWRRTLKLLPITASQKALMYRVYDEQMFTYAGALIQTTNDYLKAQGILPNLRYSHPVGAVPSSYLTPPSTLVQNSEGDEGELVQAIKDLQARLTRSDADGVGSSAPVRAGDMAVAIEQIANALAKVEGHPVKLTTAEVEQELSAADVQVLLEALGVQVGTAEPFKSDKHAPGMHASDKHAPGKDDMQTIDLVGMLFEYMLNDENLPHPVKTLLSYLHTPFLKLAFVDPGFFEQSQHPARLLLNNLAEAGARWVQPDGTSQYGIYGKIKETVEQIIQGFDKDVRVIAELLLEFSSYTKQVLRREELLENRLTEKARGEERLREVKQQVNDEVRQRIKGRELPSAVLLLLLQPWSDFLSFTLLRYGESSDHWHESLAVVDDIVWCIEPKQTCAERQRQQELKGIISTTLDAGFNVIGYDQYKARQLIEAVVGLIEQAVESKSPTPAPGPVRDELERLATRRSGKRPPSQPEPLTAQEAQMVDNLKMIEFGTWLEFEGKGRLKVAWYNNRTSHYMLVDQMGKKADMMSGVTMARALIAGQARVISGSSKPFFDRALENMFQKLNAQAEVLRDGGKGQV